MTLILINGVWTPGMDWDTDLGHPQTIRLYRWLWRDGPHLYGYHG